jgi:hypothetical protein
MAAQFTTPAAIITEARYRADAQTDTPTVDFTNDAELLTILNKATREFLDLIISFDDAAIDLLAVSAQLPPPYNLPADFYRLIDAEVPDVTTSNRWLSIKQFHFRERNDFEDEVRPRYRLIGGKLVLRPVSAAPSIVQIYYVPYGPELLANDVLTSFNGWDDFLVATVALHIVQKEDRDPQMMIALRQTATDRIRLACKDLVVAGTVTVARVEYQPEEVYDLI